MKKSIKTGLGFGITSGVITTLALIIGLFAGTNSKAAVIGGIIIIAIADSMSDALGIHISQESDKKNTQKSVWESTFSTLLTKFFVAISFLIPTIFLQMQTAILVSIVWGLFLLAVFSFYIARAQNEKLWKVIGEHLGIAIFVIIISHFLGNYIGSIF